MSFSKTFYLHCCSPPRCINGYPVGMEWVRQCGCHANLEWFLPGMDRCLIDLQASNDRGNNIVKRLEMIINHIRRYINRNIIIITVIIVIWPLFRRMPVNQKPLNRIGIFWYQFTPRKLLYLLISLNLVRFGPHWLSVFFLDHLV